MSRTVDARGLTCPQPVILTKHVMDEKTGEDIITLVDNTTSLENVCRLAKNQGYAYTVEEVGTEHHIHLSKELVDISASDALSADMAILVKSQFLGSGADELGAVLMKSFLYTITQSQFAIRHIIFVNGGVYLSTQGSPVLEHLRALEQNGVQILSCGTCLDFYSLKDKLEVGEVTNMYTILETMCNATKTMEL